MTNIGASNGLLRQYFPKGSDLRDHSNADLDWVAAELNDRPRKRLDFRKPIEEIGDLLLRWRLSRVSWNLWWRSPARCLP